MRETIKVCIATTNFPRWKGDFRVPFIYEAARAVNKHGHQVKVLTLHTPGASTHEFFDDIEVIRAKYLPENMEVLQKDASGIPEAWRRGFLPKLATIPFLLSFANLIGKHAKSSDIIHCNWSLSGLAAYLSKFRHNTPYVITVQGSDIFKTFHIPVIRTVIGLALKKAEHIIALSEDLRTATSIFGVPMERITVIPNGVNIDQFPLGEESERKSQIIFVGSLIERKGVNYLIEAMAIVKKKHPECELLLVGEGRDRDEYEKLVHNLGLEETVFFLGVQSQQNVSQLMRQSRLFVLPSIEEGQGVVLVEAMASGTPCVGSRVGGIPDVITPEVGKLVEPRNIKSLAEAINIFLDNDELWRHASLKARERVENIYDWFTLADKMIGIYDKVLNKDEI